MGNRQRQKSGKQSQRRREDKKGKIYRRRAVAAVFAVLLGTISLIDLIPGEKGFSHREDRELTVKPKMSLKGVLDGGYMREYDAYRTDQFTGRSLLRLMKTGTDLLAGRRREGGVYKGRDDYLLEEIAAPDEEQTDKSVELIGEFARRYEKIPVYLMLVPGAANVLDEKLPDSAVVRDERQSFESIRQTLETSVRWVDVSTVLEKHMKEEIYYHTDRHWTSLGAYYAYQALAEVMKLDMEKAPGLEPYAVTNSFNGMLSSASGYNTGYAEPIFIYTPKNRDEEISLAVEYVEEGVKTATLYDRSKLIGKNEYEVFLGGSHGMVDIRTTADTTDRLLIVKDSYANCLIPFLTPFYRELIVIEPGLYEGDLDTIMEENKISSVLFLYGGNTFVQDSGISRCLE